MSSPFLAPFQFRQVSYKKPSQVVPFKLNGAYLLRCEVPIRLVMVLSMFWVEKVLWFGVGLFYAGWWAQA